MPFTGERTEWPENVVVSKHVNAHVSSEITNYVEQVAQLSQRDRAAGWVSNGQKWKTGTERQYLRTM